MSDAEPFYVNCPKCDPPRTGLAPGGSTCQACGGAGGYWVQFQGFGSDLTVSVQPGDATDRLAPESRSPTIS